MERPGDRRHAPRRRRLRHRTRLRPRAGTGSAGDIVRTFALLRRVDRPSSPWKNGGGITWTVAMDPQDGSIGDFSWRLSLAQVGVAGPFSYFPDVDRILTVVEGRLLLQIDGAERRLGAADSCMAFAGEDPVCGAPEGDVALDLNLMLRRGRCSGAIRRLPTLGTPCTGPDVSPAMTTIVMVFTGPGSVEDDEGGVEVGYLDAIRMAAPDFGILRIASPWPAYRVEINHRAGVAVGPEGERS
ncbi:HutD/Ves family protein [Caulobacter sp. LARHSG274]